MAGTFSWARATLAGFDVLRREPRLLLTWGLVGLIFTVAQQVMAVNADIFRKVNPTSVTAVVLSFAGGLISIGALAIFSAAAYRAVLLPGDLTRARIRLGGDEVRLALVWLVQGVLLLFPLMIMAVGVGLTTSSAEKHSMAVFVIDLALFLAASFVGGLLLARLSVAGPMSLMEGGWSLPAAWRLTRGKAWKIAGVHVCVALMVAGAYWVCRMLYALVVEALGGRFSFALTSGGTSVAAVFQPETLIFSIFSALLGAAGAAVLYAPAAVIYRDLTGLTPDDQASVFD